MQVSNHLEEFSELTPLGKWPLAPNVSHYQQAALLPYLERNGEIREQGWKEKRRREGNKRSVLPSLQGSS